MLSHSDADAVPTQHARRAARRARQRALQRRRGKGVVGTEPGGGEHEQGFGGVQAGGRRGVGRARHARASRRRQQQQQRQQRAWHGPSCRGQPSRSKGYRRRATRDSKGSVKMGGAYKKVSTICRVGGRRRLLRRLLHWQCAASRDSELLEECTCAHRARSLRASAPQFHRAPSPSSALLQSRQDSLRARPCRRLTARLSPRCAAPLLAAGGHAGALRRRVWARVHAGRDAD